MTQKDYNKLVDALNVSLALNVADKLAQKNIAVAIGQAFNFSNNEISQFRLDRFVEACTKEW